MIEMRQNSNPVNGFSRFDRRDQRENPRVAASEGSLAQKTVEPITPESISVRYVYNGGSDANDGLSWRTAKRTIYGALVSLPGGGRNEVGSGTVYVGPATLANPTVNAGIWLMGANDPNYINPAAGWLKCGSCTVNIIGFPNYNSGPNAHKNRVLVTSGSGIDTNHPAIWLSNTNSPIYIANIGFQYPGRGIVIGECSNHDRTGICQATSVVLENTTAVLNQIASNGPCTDITGSSFWIWLRDFGCGGNAYVASRGYRSNQAAAILIDGTGNTGNGLIFVTDANLAGGGIKFIQGANGGSLYADNVIEEGDFVHKIPPVVWFTGFSNASDSKLTNIQIADNGPTPTPTVENDAAGGSGPTVVNGTGPIQGPATVLNTSLNSVVGSTTSPLRQGQVGFFNGYMVGETDVARRIGGLVSARFVNKANPNTTTWTYTNVRGVQTFTRDLTDPYGGNGAASISSSASTIENLQMGACAAYRPAAGDWIVGGVWAKGWSPTITGLSSSCYGYPVPEAITTSRNKGMLIGDGQWQYQWFANKVSSGSGTYIGLSGAFSKTITPTLYGPTLYIIPAGTLSDNEVLEFVSSMNSVDPGCQVGQICNVEGHPVAVSSYRTLLNCSSASTPANCGSAPAGSFVLEVGSTTARVNTTSVTANSQILVIEDSSLGDKLRVSCNKSTGRTYTIMNRAPGLSFTVNSSFAPADHPACLSFQLLN